MNPRETSTVFRLHTKLRFMHCKCPIDHGTPITDHCTQALLCFLNKPTLPLSKPIFQMDVRGFDNYMIHNSTYNKQHKAHNPDVALVHIIHTQHTTCT